jgi:hypothetical protein
VLTYDFNPADEPWSQDIERGGGEGPITERGVTRVGGYTIALALVLGFDIGKAIKPSPAASAKLE